jgi:FkbM family methyltransferase
MRRIIQPDANCIDVGCHKGLYLDRILRLAPRGTHAAFEPLPELCELLRARYAEYPNVAIHEVALSSCSGQMNFQFNKTNPGWSGLKRRSYPSEKNDLQVLAVRVQSLDEIFREDARIDFAKMDVEGAELDVLRGGNKVLSRNRPLIIFEYGLGSSEFYDAEPTSMFAIIAQFGLYVSSIEQFLAGAVPMTPSEFIKCYFDHTSYYFVAYTDAHAEKMRTL